MRFLGLFRLLFTSGPKKVHRLKFPDDKKTQHGPIRYVGNPTDIYLA